MNRMREKGRDEEQERGIDKRHGNCFVGLFAYDKICLLIFHCGHTSKWGRPHANTNLNVDNIDDDNDVDDDD